MEKEDFATIQAKAVFAGLACHIVKHSPHNKGLVIEDRKS